MATSASYNQRSTANDIIESALSKIGVKQEGEAIPPEAITTAIKELNHLVKFLSAKEGRHLWKRQEVLVFLNPSQARYRLGPTDTDTEWCLEDKFTDTKLNGALAADATAVTVDSTTGMRAGDRIGIELTAGTREWLNIISIDSATTLTIPAISAAASDNATVYTYTPNTEEVVRLQTLVNGALSASVTTIVVDSTTGMADGDRFSYVATDGTTVFSVITSVASGTNLTVPTTAKAIGDNAILKIYKDVVRAGQPEITTSLNGAASASDETVTVDSTAGMYAGDQLHITLTAANVEKTFVEKVVSGTVLAIPPLSAAASDDADVSCFTIRPQRPLRILHARRKDGPDGEDITVDVEAQEEYRDQPLKTGTGTPVFISYKPEIESGILEVWQPPSAPKMYLALTVAAPFEDIDASANDVDFPTEWTDPLVWMLADRLEPEYRLLDQLRLQKVSSQAEQAWNWVNQFDDDTGSVYFHPEYQDG